MNKFSFISTIILLSLFSFTGLVSCSEKEPYPEDRVPDVMRGLEVDIAERGSVTDTRDGDNTQELSENEKATILLDDKFKYDFSNIFITQYGPLNQNPDILNDNPERFVYVYKPNEAILDQINWNNYYNFASVNPDEEDKMLNWDHINSIGSVGNGYWLFGFYYPFDNLPRFKVEPDQSNLDALRKSNIFGAFHQAPALNTRLRFRLHHLMVYLKVTVLVPVYTDQPDEDGNTNTGFLPNALVSSKLLNAYTNFGINWSWPRSSDTEGPLVTLPTTTTIPDPEGGDAQIEVPLPTSDINLYLHPFIDASGSQSQMPSEQDIVEIPNIGDYQPDATGSDRCYKYEFSVLFPPQSFTGNFLKFSFRNPLGIVKNYNFSGSNDETVSGTLKLDRQGDLQTIVLYLPRKGNKAILINANVKDWDQAGATTNVTMKGNKNNNGSGSDSD